MIEQRKLRRRRIDGIRANGARWLAAEGVFGNRRVQMAARRIENKISRRIGLGEKSRKAEHSGSRIELRDGKSAAMHADMRAEENPGVLRARRTTRHAANDQNKTDARGDAPCRL